MGPTDLLLGIDVGTSSVKLTLPDAEGRLVAEQTRAYAVDSPRPLWSEQDPASWWQGVCAGLRALWHEDESRRERVAAIGLTGQMHGLVLLDARGAVVRPCILWNDQRTAAECREITARVGPQRVIELTGNPVLAGFTAPKIAWVRKHEPENFSRVAHILLPKDYVRYRLSGEFASDVSDASGTSLFDVAGRRWSDTMIDALELPRDWLPPVSESVTPCAKVSREAAGETGLRPETPIVAGAGDQAAQAVGTGIISPGDMSVTLGTSGVVFAVTDAYRPEPQGRLHAFCHAVPGVWHVMGVMLAAGGSVEWLCGVLGVSAAELSRLAQEAPAGAEGLLFLPYLSGERTPHADPLARGAFIGLTARHARAHLARAVLEGVCFGLRDSLELVRGLGVQAERIRVSGGGAQSALWRQTLADVLATEIATVGTSAGASFGAALLAGVGGGVFASPAEAVARAVHEGERVRPGPAARRYAAGHARYAAQYPLLRDEFAALAALAESPSA
ncbi:MAG: xylulokinase [Phycisphaerae bacterium]|jgi:xylulokinase